jgi:hypothetical protein
MSADDALDGQEMQLADALATVGSILSGAFNSCVPGKLGYLEHEDIKSAYLLKK